MLHFFKKSKIRAVYAPVTGECIDLSRVNDPVFSQKLMGDGQAIIPSDCVIKAPIGGKLILLAKTKHAFGILTEDNIEVLVHIGINTVALNGAPFETYKKEGDIVQEKEPIIRILPEYIQQNQYDFTTIVVITNPSNKQIIHKNNASVTSGDLLLELKNLSYK